MMFPAGSTRTFSPAFSIKDLMYLRPSTSASLNATRLTPPSRFAPYLESSLILCSIRFGSARKLPVPIQKAGSKSTRQTVGISFLTQQLYRRQSQMKRGDFFEARIFAAARFHMTYSFLRQFLRRPEIAIDVLRCFSAKFPLWR